MGFLVTTLIFVVVGVIACFCAGICCNRGPSTNLFEITNTRGVIMENVRASTSPTLFCLSNKPARLKLLHLTLIITATVCCWMMWAIVYLAQLKPLIVPILSEGE